MTIHLKSPSVHLSGYISGSLNLEGEKLHIDRGFQYAFNAGDTVYIDVKHITHDDLKSFPPAMQTLIQKIKECAIANKPFQAQVGPQGSLIIQRKENAYACEKQIVEHLRNKYDISTIVRRILGRCTLTIEEALEKGVEEDLLGEILASDRSVLFIDAFDLAIRRNYSEEVLNLLLDKVVLVEDFNWGHFSNYFSSLSISLLSKLLDKQGVGKGEALKEIFAHSEDVPVDVIKTLLKAGYPSSEEALMHHLTSCPDKEIVQLLLYHDTPVSKATITKAKSSHVNEEIIEVLKNAYRQASRRVTINHPKLGPCLQYTPVQLMEALEVKPLNATLPVMLTKLNPSDIYEMTNEKSFLEELLNDLSRPWDRSISIKARHLKLHHAPLEGNLIIESASGVMRMKSKPSSIFLPIQNFLSLLSQTKKFKQLPHRDLYLTDLDHESLLKMVDAKGSVDAEAFSAYVGHEASKYDNRKYCMKVMGKIKISVSSSRNHVRIRSHKGIDHSFK